jgi:hypothetical protein
MMRVQWVTCPACHGYRQGELFDSVREQLPRTIMVRKRWFWWSAYDPDETLGMCEVYTTRRALTREGVIEKWRRQFFRPELLPHEEVEVRP